MRTHQQSPIQKYIQILEKVYAKAPALPKNIKEVLVKILPAISLGFGILGLLSVIEMFRQLSIASGPLTTLSISAICSIASVILLLCAYEGLKEHKYSGWMLLFWSEIVKILASLIMLDILGAIISALISFYLLFQIKSHYK